MGISGSQLGFDEGGVLAALSDPIYTKTTIKYRHNKDGLVTSQETTVVNITGAHIVALALGPALLALFSGILNVDLDDEMKGAMLGGSVFGLGGALAGYLLGEIPEGDAPATEQANWMFKWIERLTGVSMEV